VDSKPPADFHQREAYCHLIAHLLISFYGVPRGVVVTAGGTVFVGFFGSRIGVDGRDTDVAIGRLSVFPRTVPVTFDNQQVAEDSFQ
jgi:hypothetical protein